MSEGARIIAYVGLGARKPDVEQNFKVGDRVRARLTMSRLPHTPARNGDTTK
jgi:hypothetical protein